MSQKKISDTRWKDGEDELRVRLRLTLKCNEKTHFYHEETPKEEQFISATHFVDKDVIDVVIFTNKVQEELRKALDEQHEAATLAFNAEMRAMRLRFCIEREIMPHEINEDEFYEWVNE